MLFATVWPLQWAQSRQFQGLVARIHAEQPLYASTLSTDDGNWSPSKSQGVLANYSSAGLTLSPGAGVMLMESQRQYGDIAVEAMMHGDGLGQYDGMGFVLRGSFGDPDAVTVTINQDGTWTAADLDSTLIDPYAVFDEQNFAIHTDGDAANTLLVLLRGPQYLIFINGQYVGAYYHAPAHVASIGLWVNSIDGATGTFSVVKIYPAVY